MSYFTILRFKHSATLNKYLLEKCLRQYLMYSASVYSTGINNHKKYITKNERIARRKALRSQILQDIKQTKRKVEEIIEKENIWTVPNLLCMGRIVTSPYLSYLILSQDYQVKCNNISPHGYYVLNTPMLFVCITGSIVAINNCRI